MCVVTLCGGWDSLLLGTRIDLWILQAPAVMVWTCETFKGRALYKERSWRVTEWRTGTDPRSFCLRTQCTLRVAAAPAYAGWCREWTTRTFKMLHFLVEFEKKKRKKTLRCRIEPPYFFLKDKVLWCRQNYFLNSKWIDSRTLGMISVQFRTTFPVFQGEMGRASLLIDALQSVQTAWWNTYIHVLGDVICQSWRS